MIGFGNYSIRQAEATAIADWLVGIDPQEPGFFNAVCNCTTTDKNIEEFIKAIFKVRAANLGPFYKPIFDPSEDGGKIIYKKGMKPAVFHSYNWWAETASRMPAVEGKRWHLATEYQYYAFLVWLINRLVRSGESVEEALNQVVNDSRELGHYRDSENSTKAVRLEYTGSRGVCGVYDLANTVKILSCSDEEAGGFWLAGGHYPDFGYDCSLAGLYRYTNVGNGYSNCVGMLVLY